MHCFIRSSKSKGRVHTSLIERFWKGLDCSTMPSKTNPEGNKPFRKESHGPGHPVSGNHHPPGGAMVPSTWHIYMSQLSILLVPSDVWYTPAVGKQGLTGRFLRFLKEIKGNQRKNKHGSLHVPVCCMSALRGAAKCSILLQAQDEC